MSKPLPNASTVEQTFSMEYLDRSFLVALNQIGQHEFSGKFAYALYRNSKNVDKLIREFQKQMDTLLRSHTDNDGKGGVAMEDDGNGGRRPKFRSEEDHKTYKGLWDSLYRRTPVKLLIQTVSEEEFERAITSIEGGIASNVLTTLRPMIQDAEDEQDTATVPPLSIVPKQDVPSGPVVINTPPANGNDPLNGTNDQPDDLHEPAQESPTGPVLERTASDAEHDGNGVLHGADDQSEQPELPQ